MASNENTAKIPDVSAVHGSPVTSSKRPTAGSGKVVPPVGTVAASRVITTDSPARVTAAPASHALKPAVQRPTDPQGLIEQLNKHLNDSGLPAQFRIDPAGKLIQQVNPSTGEVISELPVSEFPALARSLGASGLLLDSRA